MERFRLPVAVAVVAAWLAIAVSISAQSQQSAFDQLSAGNQKIARALFQAQGPRGVLTLDEIAALKLSGPSWTEIFQDLMGRDIVSNRSIGYIMRQHKAEIEQSARTSPSGH